MRPDPTRLCPPARPLGGLPSLLRPEGPPGAPRTCATWFPGGQAQPHPGGRGARETGVGGLVKAIMGLEEFPFI